METLGPFKGVYRDNTPIMENQVQKKMENEMETVIISTADRSNSYRKPVQIATFAQPP